MAILLNRQGLKDLTSFSIDEQFCQQFGGQVFRYSGGATPAYRELCAGFSLLVDHMIDDMQAIKRQIPVFGKGGTQTRLEGD